MTTLEPTGGAQASDVADDRFGLRRHSAPELLLLYDAVLERLRELNVVRSSNNPVSDYAELLVTRALGLALEPQSVTGYDARSADGTRYQIKGRRPTRHNPSRQLSAIRGLGTPQAEPALWPFDFLVGVLFYPDFSVWRAASIPVAAVRPLSRWTQHVNAWRFILRDSVWKVPGVVDITDEVRAAAER